MKDLFEKVKKVLLENDGFLDSEQVAYQVPEIEWQDFWDLWYHIAGLAGHAQINIPIGSGEFLIYVEIDDFKLILRYLQIGEIALQMITPNHLKWNESKAKKVEF